MNYVKALFYFFEEMPVVLLLMDIGIVSGAELQPQTSLVIISKIEVGVEHLLSLLNWLG